jgi:hypothetical protein
MTHPNIHSFSGDGIFLTSWNESYVVQFAMWNNTETRLFWITTRSVRLDCEMVASVLEA